MQTRTLVFLAIAVALLTVGVVILFIPEPAAVPANAHTIPYLFSVGDATGIDAGTDIFRLGQVTPGGTAWRTLTIEPTLTSLNQDNRTVRQVKVWARGAGASWLTIEPSTLELPGTVKITIRTPSSADKQQYRGVIVIEPLPAE